MRLKECLESVLSAEELVLAPSGFDVIGDIAIVEIAPELVKREKVIAQTILGMVNHVKVVVKKHGIHAGKFRVQRYRILAGARRKTTIHKESGVQLKLHLEKTYYSPRSSTERLRVAKLVKEGERVLVMFSGIAPFPLVIARNALPAQVVGVELNPHAHAWGLENVMLNRLGKKIVLYQGDVRKMLPKIDVKFDRIVMPLPKDAELFLADALGVAREGTIIHLYQFGREEEITAMKERVTKTSADAGWIVEVADVVKAGQYSPYVFRLCFDILCVRQAVRNI